MDFTGVRDRDFLRAGERAGEMFFDRLVVRTILLGFDDDILLGALTPGVRLRGERSGCRDALRVIREEDDIVRIQQ
jgi:hypothetical protein